MSNDSRRPRGNVLPFSAPALRPRRFHEAGASERGTVLLFTGVRYQRMPEEPFAPDRSPTGAERHLGA